MKNLPAAALVTNTFPQSKLHKEHPAQGLPREACLKWHRPEPPDICCAFAAAVLWHFQVFLFYFFILFCFFLKTDTPILVTLSPPFILREVSINQETTESSLLSKRVRTDSLNFSWLAGMKAWCAPYFSLEDQAGHSQPQQV